MTEQEILNALDAEFEANPVTEAEYTAAVTSHKYYSSQRFDLFRDILGVCTGAFGVGLSLAGDFVGARLVLGVLMVVGAVVFRRLDLRNRTQIIACEPFLLHAPEHMRRLRLEAALTAAAKRQWFGWLTTYNQISRFICLLYALIGFGVIVTALYTLLV